MAKRKSIVKKGKPVSAQRSSAKKKVSRPENSQTDEFNILNDILVPYQMLHTTTGTKSYAVLAEAKNKPESRMTALEKMEMVRLGISKKSLEELKEKADLDYADLEKALSVTKATLINKKGATKFNTAISERIVSLADIYSYGYEVFEDKSRFNQWMFRPNQALGGQMPYQFLDNQFGREEIKALIGRIDYGVYS